MKKVQEDYFYYAKEEERDYALGYMRRLTKTKLACSKTVIELTTYNGTALWWFIDVAFYRFLCAVLSKGFTDTPRRPRFGLRDIYRGTAEVLVDIGQKILMRIVLSLRAQKSASWGAGDSNRKVVFTAQDLQWRAIKDDETGRTKKSDAFFDSITKKLAGKCECVGVYPVSRGLRLVLPEVVRGTQILVDKLTNWYVSARPFEVYWSPTVSKAQWDASRYFRKRWSELVRDMTFAEICMHNEGSASEHIWTKLEYYFRVAFPFLVKYIEMAKRMIDMEKPDLILMENEDGVFERALVVAAKQRGVPTLAIQHGEIYPFYMDGYMYVEGEISAEGSAGSPYCPIPDKTAVYGAYYRDLLTKVSRYPENSVVVTGQPRYDRLHHARRVYSKESFLRRYNIKPEHKVILWASNGLSAQERTHSFKAILKAMRGLGNTTLVIKPHPAQPDAFTKIVVEYAGRSEVNVVLTSGRSDIYEQLFACDLVITKQSTTGKEAVALDKPLLILNLSGEPDWIDYVREGVALGVYKEEELGTAIEKLLKDDSELSRNRRMYVEKYLYGVDGKASERVIDLIWKMIEDSWSTHGISMSAWAPGCGQDKQASSFLHSKSTVSGSLARCL